MVKEGRITIDKGEKEEGRKEKNSQGREGGREEGFKESRK